MEQYLREVLTGNFPNYIYPFLWLSGEEKGCLINEVRRIHESGIGGLCIESRTHEGFCRQEWWEDVSVVLEECRKWGMDTWILDDKRFPSGYADGIIERKYPELKKWEITERHMDVSGPVREGAAAVEGWKAAPEDEVLAVLACERVKGSEVFTGKVMDLTADVQGGMVYFELPEGCYRIVFLMKTRSGMSGRELVSCDKLNPLATQAYIEAVYEPHFQHLKKYFGTTLKGFFSDEPRFGNNIANQWWTSMGEPKAHYPWHDCVARQLRERYGEGMYRRLLGIWFDFADEREAEIRISYMDIITKEYRDNFCNQLAAWCHGHGVMYLGHVFEDNGIHYKTGVGAGHYFRSTEGQDMSGIDIVIQQVVPGMTQYRTAAEVVYGDIDAEFYHYILPKLGASHAHIQQSKQGRALCEIFGAYGWPEGLKMMKWLTDFALVRGINHFVPHAFSLKPDNPDAPPHFYAAGKNPQYKDFRILMQYMNRLCHLLNGGIHVASALILYGAQADWTGRECMSMEKVAKALYDNQLDYDIVPEDYLKKIHEEDGKLRLNEENYDCLIVPYSKYLPVAVLKELKRISDCGMSVIFVEQYVEAVAEGGEIARWIEEGEYMKRVPLADLPSYMRNRGMADVSMEHPDMLLRVYHYRRGGSHIYMLNNENAHHMVESRIKVSAFKGGEYAVYDGLENQAVLESSTDGSVLVSLHPYQSVILIFGETEGISKAKSRHIVDRLELKMPFSISLAEEREELTYSPYREESPLFNITGREGTADFSGHMRYQAQFWLEKEGNYMLDLGYVGETAKVLVNGWKVGVRIAPPYRFDISKAVEKGRNFLEIVVTNHYGYRKKDRFGKYLIYEASGLLGPIVLEEYEEK